MLAKFSFITSSSKGLIGYSLRYSGRRAAAMCMRGVISGWDKGKGGRDKCRAERGVSRRQAHLKEEFREKQKNKKTFH